MTSLQNLFVAKLPRNLTDGDLKQIFNDYNPTNAKVMLDATTGKSKGFGFVLFESEECGRIAYDELNRKHISLHGHAFNLCIFPSKHDGNIANEPSHALYIRNIPRTLSQSSVEDFLRGFGNLAYCAMREDHYGEPVWVVYAEFDSVESARATLNSIHGSKTYFNTSVAILAKYADSAEAKRERRKRREQNNGTAVANSPVCCNSYMPTEQPNSPTQVMQHGSSASSPVTSMYAPASPQHYAPIKDPYWPRYSNNNNNNHHSRNNSQHSLASMAPPPMDIPPGDVFPQQPFLTACFPGPNTHFCECAATGRASPTTPLSYSMCDAPFDQNGGSSTASACAVGPQTNTNTPRRGSTGNVSGTYRHNPYAPVTPVSSANSSAGPNSPISNSVAAYRSSPVPCCHGCYTCGAKTLQSCCEPMLQNQQQQQHGCSGPSTTTTPSVHVHCGSQSTCIPGTGSPHFSSSCHNGFLAAQHTAAK